MGKYVEAQLLSLADPSKTDSPLKAIGNAMINVAEYHKKWQLDKIKDKLANNELDLSNINLDIAKATKDDKIAMSNLGVEKAEVDLDTAKIDKDAKEFDLGLKKIYDENVILQNLANQKAQEKYTNANALTTYYNLQNQKTLDNANTYILNVLSSNPTLDSLEPKDRISFIVRDLQSKLNETTDKKQRQELEQTLKAVNQFGLSIINDISKADSTSLVVGQNRDTEAQKQREINSVLGSIGATNLDEYYKALPEAKQKLDEYKAMLSSDSLSDSDKKAIEKNISYLQKVINAEDTIKEIKKAYDPKSKTEKTQPSLSRAEQKDVNTLMSINDTRKFIADFMQVVKHLDKTDLGIVAYALPSNIKWGLGITEKTTPTDIYQRYVDTLKKAVIELNKSGKTTKLELEALLNTLPQDKNEFGLNPEKSINKLIMLDSELNKSGLRLFSSMNETAREAYERNNNSSELIERYNKASYPKSSEDTQNQNKKITPWDKKRDKENDKKNWENLTD